MGTFKRVYMQSANYYQHSNRGVTQYGFQAYSPKCVKIMNIAVTKYFGLPSM